MVRAIVRGYSFWILCWNYPGILICKFEKGLLMCFFMYKIRPAWCLFFCVFACLHVFLCVHNYLYVRWSGCHAHYHTVRVAHRYSLPRRIFHVYPSFRTVCPENGTDQQLYAYACNLQEDIDIRTYVSSCMSAFKLQPFHLLIRLLLLYVTAILQDHVSPSAQQRECKGK